MFNKVLYIASNIPLASRRGNKVILDLAQKMSEHFDIEFIYPKPFVPFILRWHKKHRPNYNLKPWKVGDIRIHPQSFLRLPSKNMAFFFFKSFKYPFDTPKPTLSHAHFLIPDGIFSYYLYREEDIPYVLTFRGADVRKLKKLDPDGYDFKLLVKIVNNASKLFCLNHEQQSAIRTLFDLEARVTYNGISADMVIDYDKSEKSETEIIITSIGALIPQKHMTWVIKAVLNYKGDKAIKLNILGKGPDESKLKDLASKSDRIQFCGHLPRAQVLAKLKKSQIFALPSINETFGLVFLEAAATGNAMIGRTNEGIWKHFIPDEEMIYVDNYEEFENKLHLLIDNTALRQNLGKKACRRSKDFTWDNLQRQMKRDYEEIISSSNKPQKLWSN